MGASPSYFRMVAWAYLNYGTQPEYFNENYSDSFTTSDIFTKKPIKNFSDGSTITDVFSRTVQYSRAFSDSFSPTEAIALTTTKNFADSSTITDLYYVKTTKPFSDSSTITDTGFVGTANYCDPTYVQLLATYVSTGYITF